jgi:hypothetical protein
MSAHFPYGQAAYGPFMPEYLLRAGADQQNGYPATFEEVQWLGTFINQLGAAPWLPEAGHTKRIRRVDGNLAVDKMATDYGATLFLLALIGIEADGLDSFGPPPMNSRTYYAAIDILAWRRKTGDELPQWLADAVDSMPPHRRDLAWKWLNNEVNFVESSL